MLPRVQWCLLGLALVIGLVAMWSGRTHDPETPTDSALVQEVRTLRREIHDQQAQLRTLAASHGALARELAEWKQREEADAVVQATATRTHEARQVLLAKHSKDASRRDAAETDIDPNTSPTDQVRGKITRIDAADSTLVEVNLGKDAGLEKHNTLEVFRVDPHPEYVGRLRIFEVYSQRAVCRLVSTNPLKRLALKVGDQVNSQSR